MRRAVSRTQQAQPGGFDSARLSEAGCHTLQQLNDDLDFDTAMVQ
jgi:hypothetical protein